MSYRSGAAIRMGAEGGRTEVDRYRSIQQIVSAGDSEEVVHLIEGCSQ